MATSTAQETGNATLYFGYGSNLWKCQMRTRCPGSTFRGLARLEAYRWIINGRGYANVVEVESREESVWGMVYALTPRDEARLDVNEGVPVAYTKEMMQVEFWPVKGREDGGGKLDVSGEPPEQTEMLVYVDRVRVEPDVPKKEYIYRMNKGIADAVAEGMPGEYVERVMRKFIPEDWDGGEADGEVRRLARKQAESFEDEI